MKRIVLTMNEEKKYQTIKAVYEKKKSKLRASVELNLSIRQINRLLSDYKMKGKSAFIHGNKGKKSIKAISRELVEKIVAIYTSFTPHYPNIVHFTEILAQDHDIHLSDTTVRQMIYNHNIVSPKSHRKTKRRINNVKKLKEKNTVVSNETVVLEPTTEEFLADITTMHPSRPRKKYCGELIQMDASCFNFFGDSITHLHVAIDDASGNIVGAYFDTQETLKGYYQVLYQILLNYGIPVQFITDRRTVFDFKKKRVKTLEEDTATQFGFACQQLGIQLTAISVPEAKGRVERLNATLQSRLPVDLQREGITTIEEANRFLEKWIQQFNLKFGNKTQENVFEQAPSQEEINLILARVSQRVINNGNYIRFQNKYYIPTENGEKQFFSKGTQVLVIESFDHTIYLTIANKTYTVSELLSHELVSETFDEIAEIPKEKATYIPPKTHPWKEQSFKRYLSKIGKTLAEYELEKASSF